MTSAVGPFQTGGTPGTSSGMMDQLRVRIIALRYASDRLLESSLSFDWMSMMNAELTVENRPACKHCQHSASRRGAQQRTKIRVVLRSSLCFCMESVLYSVVSCLYMVKKSSRGSSLLIGWRNTRRASWMLYGASLVVLRSILDVQTAPLRVDVDGFRVLLAAHSDILPWGMEKKEGSEGGSTLRIISFPYLRQGRMEFSVWNRSHMK